MKRCPDCGDLLEVTEEIELQYRGATREGRIYSCPSCGGEWISVKGQRVRQIGESVLDLTQILKLH